MKYFVYHASQVLGPYEIAKINELLEARQIDHDDQACVEGRQEWVSVKNLSGITVTPEDLAFQKTRPSPPDDVRARQEFSQGNIFSHVADGVSRVSGLEKLDGFDIKHFFSQVLRRHTPEEIEDQFSTGTRATTPSLAEVNASWPSPWAFVRLLALSFLASIAFYWAIDRFNNPNFIPGWIFVGCFGIPFSVLVFFIEANVLRNVSFYRVMNLLILGGLISLLAASLLGEYSKLDAWMGAMSAGLVEETGKILAVVFFTRKWERFGWILNGMLFGAAVGAGFAAFESAGYVFMSIFSAESFNAEFTMALRAFLTPFTHIIWTAATAAALWRLKGNKPFEFGMLFDVRFLRVFGFVVALHTLWNSPLVLPVVGGMPGYLGFRVLLGIVGWIVIFLMMQAGLRQVQEAQRRSEREMANIITAKLQIQET